MQRSVSHRSCQLSAGLVSAALSRAATALLPLGRQRRQAAVGRIDDERGPAALHAALAPLEERVVVGADLAGPQRPVGVGLLAAAASRRPRPPPRVKKAFVPSSGARCSGVSVALVQVPCRSGSPHGSRAGAAPWATSDALSEMIGAQADRQTAHAVHIRSSSRSPYPTRAYTAASPARERCDRLRRCRRRTASLAPSVPATHAPAPAWTPTRGLGQRHRHHHRVVRLLHLRHRRGHRLRAAVLSPGVRAGRHAGGVCHVRHRLHRPPARRRGDGPLRRPARPQVHAGVVADADGAGDARHRPAPHLRGHRRVGAGAARRAAVRPGLRAGRRMGRRRADVGGARAAGPARPVRQLRGAGAADRHHRVEPGVPGRLDGRGARRVRRVGVARAVCRQLPAGGGRPLGAGGHRGEPGLRQRHAVPRRAAGCRWSTCCAPMAHGASRRRHVLEHQQPGLHRAGVLRDLRNKAAGTDAADDAGLVMGSAVVFAGSIVVFAHYSDRLGRQRVMRWGLGLLVLWSLVFFPLADTGSVPLIALSLSGMLVIQGAYIGPQPAVFSELFPTTCATAARRSASRWARCWAGPSRPAWRRRSSASRGRRATSPTTSRRCRCISWLCSFGLRETYRDSLE